MTPRPLAPTLPAERLTAVLREEIETTLRAFRAPPDRTAGELLPLYAEHLASIANEQELRLVFSVARQRATTEAPTPGEVREVLIDLRRRRSHAPRGVTPLPAAPRFDEAERWLAANPWAEAQVDQEVDRLTRDWAPELAAERGRFRPVARLLVFNRLSRPEGRSA